MSAYGIRPALRALANLWRNRGLLPALWHMLATDRAHPSTISIARRLVARGHSASAHGKLPVAEDGSAVPWYTYPFLDFLGDFDFSGWDVLEFGSGQSTLFWAGRARRVLAFEHNPRWIEALRARLPSNAEVRPFEGQRSLAALGSLEWKPGLVVIDGCKRLECAKAALQHFGESPLYVLENSDWLPQTAAFLRGSGLAEIRFKGFGPVNSYAWCTSLLVSGESLFRLEGISPACDVPGGLPAADFELRDREMQI